MNTNIKKGTALAVVLGVALIAPFSPAFANAIYVQTGNVQVNGTNATMYGMVSSGAMQTYSRFEYGTSQQLGLSTPFQTTGGFGQSNVSTYVSGLYPNTTYYYRIVAQNGGNIMVTGEIRSFTTGTADGISGNVSGSNTNTANNNSGNSGFNSNSLNSSNKPIANTTVATEIGSKAAMLNAEINPSGTYTTYQFEYGSTPSMGNVTLLKSAGSGASRINVSEKVSGLTPNVPYYYRVLAQSQTGIVYGSLSTFTTRAYGAAVGAGTTAVGGTVAKTTVAKAATATIPKGTTTAPSGKVITVGNYSYTYANSAKATKQATPDTSKLATVSSALGLSGKKTTECLAANPAFSTAKPLAGKEMSYIYTIKNVCATKYTEGLVKLTLPTGAAFISSGSEYTMDGDAFLFGLGDIEPKSEKTLTVKVAIDPSVSAGSKLSFSSIMTARDTAGKLQTVTLPVVATIAKSNTSLAYLQSAFGGTGWFNVILILTVLILIAYLSFRGVFQMPIPRIVIKNNGGIRRPLVAVE